MEARIDYELGSFSSIGGGITYEDPKFHLNLVQKKERPSDRPIIDSTKMQRLSFYRSFVSTSAKCEIVATQSVEFNSFLWYYTFNVFFKTLPHSFVHFFLAAYAPEEHNFVTKMVPFSYGFKFLYLMVGFIEVAAAADMLMILFHYALTGILRKNPWNRCQNETSFDPYLNRTVQCYNTTEFSKMFVNKSNKFYKFTFISPENQYFQLAQIEYYRTEVESIVMGIDLTFFAVIWSIIVVLHLCSSERAYWKVLQFCELSVIFIDLIAFIYLISPIRKFDESIPIASIPIIDEQASSKFWSMDLELLAESITAPNVVHVLTARSTQEIDPAQDSAVMVSSNAIVHIFRGLLSSRVKTFCEALVRTEIPVTNFNQHSWFYFWPIFLDTFYLGDLFSVIYMTLYLISDFLILVVGYKCLVETILFEWLKVKRWMIMAATGAAGLLFYSFTTNNDRVILWIYGKGIATLFETVFIYVAYPIGRLVDDFTFYYGEPPTKLRILSLRLVPVYYCFKLYVMYDSLWLVMGTTNIGKVLSHYLWSWSIMVIPILLGMLYIIYQYLVVYGVTWNYIFRPLNKWGPRDFSVRQLRKQFDSRFVVLFLAGVFLQPLDRSTTDVNQMCAVSSSPPITITSPSNLSLSYVI